MRRTNRIKKSGNKFITKYLYVCDTCNHGTKNARRLAKCPKCRGNLTKVGSTNERR